MHLSSTSPRLSAQLHIMSWDGSLTPVLVLLPHIRKWVHYIDDTTLTCKDLPWLQDTLQILLRPIQEREWAVKPQKIPDLGIEDKFLLAKWLD